MPVSGRRPQGVLSVTECRSQVVMRWFLGAAYKLYYVSVTECRPQPRRMYIPNAPVSGPLPEAKRGGQRTDNATSQHLRPPGTTPLHCRCGVCAQTSLTPLCFSHRVPTISQNCFSTKCLSFSWCRSSTVGAVLLDADPLLGAAQGQLAVPEPGPEQFVN